MATFPRCRPRPFQKRDPFGNWKGEIRRLPNSNPESRRLDSSTVLAGSSGRKKIRTPAAGSPLPGRLCWGFAGKPVSGAHRRLTYHKASLKSQLYSGTSDPDAQKPLQQRTESRPGGQCAAEMDSRQRGLSGLEVPTHTTRFFPI